MPNTQTQTPTNQVLNVVETQANAENPCTCPPMPRKLDEIGIETIQIKSMG